jgi:hypothetical protein
VDAPRALWACGGRLCAASIAALPPLSCMRSALITSFCWRIVSVSLAIEASSFLTRLFCSRARRAAFSAKSRVRASTDGIERINALERSRHGALNRQKKKRKNKQSSGKLVIPYSKFNGMCSRCMGVKRGRYSRYGTRPFYF